MGPLETADLIGLDTVVQSLDVLYESYQDSKFRCCPLLRKMVEPACAAESRDKDFIHMNKARCRRMAKFADRSERDCHGRRQGKNQAICEQIF